MPRDDIIMIFNFPQLILRGMWNVCPLENTLPKKFPAKCQHRFSWQIRFYLQTAVYFYAGFHELHRSVSRTPHDRSIRRCLYFMIINNNNDDVTFGIFYGDNIMRLCGRDIKYIANITRVRSARVIGILAFKIILYMHVIYSQRRRGRLLLKYIIGTYLLSKQ